LKNTFCTIIYLFDVANLFVQQIVVKLFGDRVIVQSRSTAPPFSLLIQNYSMIKKVNHPQRKHLMEGLINGSNDENK
jgi:hypothetical protein